MVTINRAKNNDEESASSSDYGKAFNGSPVVTDYSSLLYVDSDNVSDVSVNQEEECDESCHENDNEMDEKGSFSNETISCNTSLRNRLDEILSELARVIDSTAISKFNIARNFIWEGTKRGLGRKSFLPRNKISVKFSDDAGTSEGAVDQGGPMREFFSLVIQWMVNSQLFCGPEGKKMLTCQRKCLEEREYFYAGEILAMSLVHGGPGPECLSPTLFEALIKDDISKIAVPLDDVCDQELRSSLEDLLHTTTKDEADTIVYNSSLVMVMELAGTLEPIQTGKIEMMVNATAKWHVLGRIQPALESFKGGMCTLGVLDAVKRNPDAFRSTICYSPVKLTGQVFEEIFTVINSPVGSSRAVTESLVLSRWQDYVQDVEEEEEHPTLADILFFVIACRTLPPRKVSPEIQFLHEPEDWKEPEPSRFPKANTCSQTLFLPVVHKSYEDFKADMTFGFLNGQGFGIA